MACQYGKSNNTNLYKFLNGGYLGMTNVIFDSGTLYLIIYPTRTYDKFRKANDSIPAQATKLGPRITLNQVT